MGVCIAGRRFVYGCFDGHISRIVEGWGVSWETRVDAIIFDVDWVDLWGVMSV